MIGQSRSRARTDPVKLGRAEQGRLIEFSRIGLGRHIDRSKLYSGEYHRNWTRSWLAVGLRMGAVQVQIDDTVMDGDLRARASLLKGEGETHCIECGDEIPAARRAAIAGVRTCRRVSVGA